MMKDAILAFPQQFAFQPVIENKKKLNKFSKFVVCGMGGSSLGSQMLSAWSPQLDITIYRDYELPVIVDAKRLYIFSSYSGNTEETIDGFKKALQKKLPVAVVSIGGTLLEFARARGVSYIQLPDSGIQPRCALGFNVVSLLALMQQTKLLQEVRRLANELDPRGLESTAKALAAKLRGQVPVVYASTRNQALAANWKIKMNETGKIPSFYNVVPELNHNEMTGFDVVSATKKLSSNFHFVFLTDADDHPRIQKRMGIIQKLYEDRGLVVSHVPIAGKSRIHALCSSLLTADWTALHLAEMYGVESEQVPMVEEFKKLIQ